MPRRSSSPSRPLPRPRTTLPARPPPSVPAHPPAQPRQPGLMGQMAATAGGVAVGSVLGNAISGAFSGGSSGSSPQPATQAASSTEYQSPCQYHIDELVHCAQSQSDISACSGFSEALKECSRQYGLYH
ncbi:unnamed protein product [Heterobilharzia americana]|nr:unnamed protein product [Heterobilharzia americana]